MKKVLLDRTPLWEIRPEETIILDINSSLVENELEQIKMYYETNKEEIYINTLQEKDKEIERLNNNWNKLEEYLNKVIETSTEMESITCSFVLKYLQELKGSDK